MHQPTSTSLYILILLLFCRTSHAEVVGRRKDQFGCESYGVILSFNLALGVEGALSQLWNMFNPD